LTLVELLVVLVISAIVMTLTGTLLWSVNKDSAVELNVLKGVQEQTDADESFVQYLQGSTALLPLYVNGAQVAPSPTEMDMVVNDGFNAANAKSNWGLTQTYQSNCTNMDALVWAPASPANADAQFTVTSDVPSAGPTDTGVWKSVYGASATLAFNPASLCSPPNGAVEHQVSSLFALSTQASSPLSDPAFTYYTFTTGSVVTTTTNAASPTTLPQDIPSDLVPVLTNANGVVPVACVGSISAVLVHLTFMAGPQNPGKIGSNEPTTLNTLIYLQGNSTSGDTTTTSTSTTTTAQTCAT
jgi:hypothetical protein